MVYNWKTCNAFYLRIKPRPLSKKCSSDEPKTVVNTELILHNIIIYIKTDFRMVTQKFLVFKFYYTKNAIPHSFWVKLDPSDRIIDISLSKEFQIQDPIYNILHIMDVPKRFTPTLLNITFFFYMHFFEIVVYLSS